MGLGIAIAGSISIAVVFMVITVIPGTSDKLVDIIDARSEIINTQKKIDKTNFRISNLAGSVGNELFNFRLTNTGLEKIWNYEKFDFLVTYDADISGTKTRVNEVFTYNSSASFGDHINEIARPISDELVGGWTSTPLYSKLNEVTRYDSTFISSPTTTTTPTNDVEVKLGPLTDPRTSGGHILRYTYKVGSIPATGGLLGYGDSDLTAIKYRTWDGTNFSAESSADIPIDTGVKWMVVKSSPISNEKVMGILIDNGITKTLYIQTWNGVSWTANWSKIVTTSSERLFDISYEKSSGDVIVVYGDGSTQLKYRKRVSGTWDGSDQNAGNALTAFPRWVVTKSSPTSDDIFVAVSTDSTTLAALRWNGSTNSFSASDQVSGISIATKSSQTFDLAFESSSGNAFLIYGSSSGAGNKDIKYRIYTNSWGLEQTAYNNLLQTTNWLKADYDRDSSSKKIAIGFQRNNHGLEFGVWDGSSWISRPATVGGVNSGNRNIDVSFETGTGKAIFAFVTSDNPSQLSWRTWDTTSGFSAITTETGNVGTIRFVQLKTSNLDNSMMAMYNDGNGDLFYRKWSGSSWSSLGAALETSLSTGSSIEPFMFAWDRIPSITLVVQLRQGASTVIAQWNEGTINEVTDFIQKDRLLTKSETDSISDYTDLRVRYQPSVGQVHWSWTEFKILSFLGEVDEFGINNISGDEYDPMILNPGEYAAIIGKLQYPIYSNGLLKVTVSADNGKSASSSITVT